jgi:hypothetical protein
MATCDAGTRMRRLAAAVVVMAMLGGCTTYVGSRQTAKVGGIMSLIGAACLVVVAGMWDDHGGGSRSKEVIVYGLAIPILAGAYVGVPLAIGGLIGMGLYEKPAAELRRDNNAAIQAERDRAAAQTRQQRSAVHERLLKLTSEARALADAHECDLVKQREITVRGLNSDFHTTVFVRDAAIRRCLDAAVPAQPALVEQPVPVELPTPEAQPAPVEQPSVSP